MVSAPLLSLDSLSVFFRRDRSPLRVVSDVSFSIGRGEVFGLVGESGCGKSLTALSVLRILPPTAFTEGRIMLDDRDILAIPEEQMRALRGRDISMVFQEPMTSLNPVLTVGYQISEALQAHFDFSRRESIEKAVDLMRAVKIPSPELRSRDYPHQLSGGMRQRIMIAMAIACNPRLLIADEPTTALDVTIQAEILHLLQGLRRERDMAMLLITHDLSIVSEQADRVAIMYAGRFMETAGVEEIFRAPLHPYTRGLLDSLASIKGKPLKPIPGFVPSPDRLPQGCKFSDRCPLAMDICKPEEPELTEICPGHFVRCIRVARGI
jgi:oligopeptide/dipeptide ABC transporter ATP-binding protein